MMLTERQEVFVQALARGSTQRQAYLEAYPSRIDWKMTSVDTVSSELFSNPKIRSRYDELLVDIREEEREKTMWTREQSIKSLKFIIEVNRKDIERINDAYEEELEFLQQMTIDKPEDVPKHIELMLKRRKSRVASQVNNKGIIDAVAELNKMQGFNETTLNLNGAVMFTGEDELED